MTNPSEEPPPGDKGRSAEPPDLEALPPGIFFESNPLPILVFERGSLRILEANQAACELYGYTPGEFRTLSLTDIRPPEDIPAFLEFVRTGASQAGQMLWRHRTRAGRILQVRIVGQDIEYAGRPARVTVILEHTPAEEALALAREAEQRFHSIFEYAGHPIVVVDVDLGRFVEVNEDACRFFKLPREALLQLGPADVSPEYQPGGERSADLGDACLRRALTGEVVEFEWVHRDAEGASILCEVRLVRMPPFERRLIRGTIIDIRARRAAEAELIRREREFRTLAENSPDLIVRLDSELRIIYLNPAVLRLVPMPAARLIGRRPSEVFPGNPDVTRWEQDVAAVRDAGQPAVLEGPSGFLGPGAYTQTHIIPEFSETGDLDCILNITRDLTATHRAAVENARLASIVEYSGDAIVATDLDGRITAWNRAAEQLYGYSAAEALGRTTEFLFAPEDHDLRTAIRARVLSGETLSGIELRPVRKDGSRPHTQSTFFPIRDSNSTVVGIGAVARDITDRVRAEAALRESEARFRSLADSAPIMIWTAGPDRQVDYMSRACFEFTGRGPEILGDAWIDVIHPDDRPAVLADFEQTFEKPGLSTIRYRLLHRSGAYRWVLEHSTPRFDDSGRFCGRVGAVLDIDETVLARQALERSEARLRELLDGVAAPAWVSDGETIYFANAELSRILGVPPADVTGPRALDTFIHPEDLPRKRDYHARRRAGARERETFQLRLVRPGGEIRHLRVTAAPITFDGRDMALLSAFDVTDLVRAEEERRRLDQQMQQTQKLESLGVLAGGIAHDFNNLLVAILGNAGLALMELPPESPARQTVQAIETAAQRAAELTRQMLAYSGRGKFVVEPLNLSRLVEEMAHLLEVSVSKRAVLKYRFAPDLPLIEGDATQVRQVIMNLITNASDAIGDRSGVISISTGLMHADRAYLRTAYMDDDLPEGDYVYLEVADTGVGMDEATAARIFDPFFTTKFTGRGLGLAAVLGIVRSHRGAIKLYTEPGRGTTFKILFPVAGPPQAPEPVASPATDEPVRAAAT
uniref:PAS domain S-box protein n=1 Tax=Tepidiforma sp. TaxID=2682230 RepID=UPI002ADE7C8B